MVMLPPEQMNPQEWLADQARSLSVRPGSILTIDPDDITSDIVPGELLARYSGRELEALCSVLNISKSGTKAKKIQNIIATMRLRDRISRETVDSLMEKYKARQLKDMVRTAKGFLGGNKKQLAISLINWREKQRFMGKKYIAQHKQWMAARKAVAERRPIHVWVAREMLKPRPGGRYLTEAEIQGWTQQDDLFVPPKRPHRGW